MTRCLQPVPAKLSKRPRLANGAGVGAGGTYASPREMSRMWSGKAVEIRVASRQMRVGSGERDK